MYTSTNLTSGSSVGLWSWHFRRLPERVSHAGEDRREQHDFRSALRSSVFFRVLRIVRVSVTRKKLGVYCACSSGCTVIEYYNDYRRRVLHQHAMKAAKCPWRLRGAKRLHRELWRCAMTSQYSGDNGENPLGSNWARLKGRGKRSQNIYLPCEPLMTRTCIPSPSMLSQWRVTHVQCMCSQHQRHFPPTRALVAVEPRRPPKTNVDTETAFRHDDCKHIQKSKHLWGQRSVDTIKFAYFQLYRSTCSASRISTQKEPFLRSEFTLALNLSKLDAGRSLNAVRVHAGTTQVDFEVARHLQILHQEIFWSPW